MESVNSSAITVDKFGNCSLGYRSLRTIPYQLLTKFLPQIKNLDLSHNFIEDLPNLSQIPCLESLIVDSNRLTSAMSLSKAPKLKHFSANANAIKELEVILDKLASNFPNLEILSLLNNEACPNFFNENEASQYDEYRLFAVSKLPKLKVLDMSKVTNQEKEQAMLYKNGKKKYKSNEQLDRERKEREAAEAKLEQERRVAEEKIRKEKEEMEKAKKSKKKEREDKDQAEIRNIKSKFEEELFSKDEQTEEVQEDEFKITKRVTDDYYGGSKDTQDEIEIFDMKSGPKYQDKAKGKKPIDDNEIYGIDLKKLPKFDDDDDEDALNQSMPTEAAAMHHDGDNETEEPPRFVLPRIPGLMDDDEEEEKAPRFSKVRVVEENDEEEDENEEDW